MKKIKTTEAVGHVLCHDMTRIVKGEFDGPAFKKGHIVKEEDIPMLLSMGKEHLFVWENNEDMLHENDAAVILAELCINDGMTASDIKEGKINIFADREGLFRVNTEKLLEINMQDELMIATRHTNYPVKKGDMLVGTRVIPLVIHKDKLNKAVEIAGGEKLLEILPYKKLKVGIVTTGSEVFSGRIKDAFTPVIVEKMKAFGQEVIGHEIVSDEKEGITEAVLKLKNMGAQLILCTGGMSVDPDDMTPAAIKDSGADIVSYGSPVLPGAMLLLGYFEDGATIMGLPGCVMYASSTVFDLLLPRVLCGVKITKKDIASLGHGGLCFKCENCIYPRCEFGKGV